MGEWEWRTEMDELRGVVTDLSQRLAAAEEAREQQDAALALAIARHPANGPATEPAPRFRRRHLRLLQALRNSVVVGMPRLVRPVQGQRGQEEPRR